MTKYSPKFCYANYITSDDITVSTNSDTKDRLIDRNVERRWISTSGDETGTLTFTVTKEIDTIVICNTNMKTFTAKYDTSTDFSPALSNSVVSLDNTYNDIYLNFTSVTPTTDVIISITETTDDEALKVGQVVVTKEIHALVAGGSKSIIGQLKQFNKEMSDGSINKIYVRQSNGYDLTLINVSETERAKLLEIAELNRRSAFYFILQPADGDDAFNGLCGHMNIINEFDLNQYYNDIANNGYTGTLRLRQSSGIQ